MRTNIPSLIALPMALLLAVSLSACDEEEGRVEGVPTASSSQALRRTVRRRAIGRAMRDGRFVRLGSSWQERGAGAA